MPRPVYLDHHATTPVDERVARRVFEVMVEEYGNPSSVDHIFGDHAARLIEAAAQEVRLLIDAAADVRIVFTSGATEAINLAILGTAAMIAAKGGETPRIGLTTIEHSAVRRSAAAASSQFNAELVEIGVNDVGRIDLQQLRTACSQGLHLVCVMAANNEVGTLQPLTAVSDIVKRHGALLLVDGSQAVGHGYVSFDSASIDMLALTAHKMYGPKGVGALVTRPDLHLRPLLFGGGQQHGLRPGTINVPGAVGLGEAARIRRKENPEDEGRVAALRNLLETELLRQVPQARVNGDLEARLPGNLNISFPVPAQAVIARLRRQIAISTGSACASGLEQPSHVLQAMGLPPWRCEGALRFGLGRLTTREEVQYAATAVAEAVAEVTQLLLPS